MSLLTTCTGTILDVDEAACALVGRERSKMLGVDFCVLLTPTYRVTLFPLEAAVTFPNR
jgi:hypothetical protein